MELACAFRATEALNPERAAVRANPSLQLTCYGWLRQPPQAAELKRLDRYAKHVEAVLNGENPNLNGEVT